MQVRQTIPRTITYTFAVFFLLFWLEGRRATPAHAVEDFVGPCEPGLVEQEVPQPFIILASYHPVGTSMSGVTIEWLGHSSFLLISPGGIRLLTDPHGFHSSSESPDIVTVSNLHVTHSGTEHVAGTPRILWGITPEREWNRIVLTVKDVSLFNVPSYASRSELEKSPIQNSIFVFRTGGLCVVHLGNLRHPLLPSQLQRIGKPDIVMIPVDGYWTMNHTDVLTVIEQLKPAFVIPMHFDFPRHVEAFVEFIADRYPVRRIKERTVSLSRSLLPLSTEVIVFGVDSSP